MDLEKSIAGEQTVRKSAGAEKDTVEVTDKTSAVSDKWFLYSASLC